MLKVLAIHPSFSIVGSSNSSFYLPLPTIISKVVVALCYGRVQLCISLVVFLTLPRIPFLFGSFTFDSEFPIILKGPLFL
jgi:hypothetical protein